MNAKILLKKIFLTACAIIGYLLGMPFVLKKTRKARTWKIIRYHSVSDRRRHETNVPIGAFSEQMKHLISTYHVISLAEGFERIIQNGGFETDCVSVTFDDGYMDNFFYAYPILKSSNIPAVIFLISSFIGTRNILPHDLKDNPEANYLLSWEQIAQMDPALVQFGSHTASHFRMSHCGPDIYEKEIAGSKKLIEERTGRKVQFISYPFGTASDFTADWKPYLRKAGFLAGFLAVYGWNTAASDTCELKRIGIESSDTLFTFKAKLDGALDPLLSLSETAFGRGLKRVVNRLLGAVDYE
jgi:peptidoglycan/xylan/chitin deacetylase (PgdA/CDA1 family)